jgi:hypothetical protein
MYGRTSLSTGGQENWGKKRLMAARSEARHVAGTGTEKVTGKKCIWTVDRVM